MTRPRLPNNLDEEMHKLELREKAIDSLLSHLTACKDKNDLLDSLKSYLDEIEKIKKLIKNG